MFVPTSHDCPVQCAANDASPAATVLLMKYVTVQSGVARSRQYPSPLNPAHANSFVGDAAMLSMLLACAGSRALPYFDHVPVLRFLIHAPEPPVEANTL